MTIYSGTKKIGSLFFGTQSIAKAYRGDNLVFQKKSITNFRCTGITAGFGRLNKAWIIRKLPHLGSWSSIAYGNGIFVAIEYLSGGSNLATSPDGINWTPVTARLPFRGNSPAIEFHNGVFLAFDGGRTNIIAVSSDGVNWSQSEYAPMALAYGNGKFVGVDSSHVTSTSTDGRSWTQSGELPLVFGNMGRGCLAYGNGKFVCVNSHGATSTSTDGRSWTQPGQLQTYTGSVTPYWERVTFGNGVFIALNTSGWVAISTDGKNWAFARRIGMSSDINGMVKGNLRASYGNGTWVIVNSDVTTNDTICTAILDKANLTVAWNLESSADQTYIRYELRYRAVGETTWNAVNPTPVGNSTTYTVWGLPQNTTYELQLEFRPRGILEYVTPIITATTRPA